MERCLCFLGGGHQPLDEGIFKHYLAKMTISLARAENESSSSELSLVQSQLIKI
jgi:hypothetical protein